MSGPSYGHGTSICTRNRFGSGQCRYLNRPLPDLVDDLRRASIRACCRSRAIGRPTRLTTY